MDRGILRITTVVVLIGLTTFVAAAKESFPPPNGLTLIGQYTDTFPRTFRVGAFRLPLPQNRRYAIQYRKTNSHQYVFLCEVVQGDKGRRDVVVAVVELPGPRHHSQIIEFAYCHLAESKRANDDFVFGIIDQSIARSTYVPERAWRVDLTQLRLEELPGATVRCKPESLAGPSDLSESETSSW